MSRIGQVAILAGRTHLVTSLAMSLRPAEVDLGGDGLSRLDLLGEIPKFHSLLLVPGEVPKKRRGV